MDPTTNQNNQAELDLVLDQFKTQLLSELSFDKLSPEDQTVMEEKLGKLVNDRIINLVLIYLPEEKVAEFDQIITGGNEEVIVKYLSDNIPGISDKIANELMEIRQEIINKLKNG